jgi:hypothetical protein
MHIGVGQVAQVISSFLLFFCGEGAGLKKLWWQVLESFVLQDPQALEEFSSSFFERKDLKPSAYRVPLHLEFLKFLKA